MMEMFGSGAMSYVAENVPLWSVTIWDKRFTGVDKAWQPQIRKYKHLLASELDSLNFGGDVAIVFTGKEEGSTTVELAGDALCEGEIVSIPWGGTPSVKYCKGKFVTGDNRIATSRIPDELLNKYLYYFMKGRLGEIGSYYRGAGLKHPSMKSVLAMRISYPSVEEQLRIISQFEMLEDVIDACRKQLSKLDDLVKSRFVEMFEGSDYPTVRLGEGVSRMHIGPFGSALKNDCFCSDSEADCVVYEQKHAIRNQFDGDYRFVNAKKHAELARFEVGPGDFIVSCRGTIGKVAEIPEGAPRGIIHPSLMVISADRTKFDSGYFRQLLENVLAELEAKAKGNCVKMAVRASELALIEVTLPPLAAQEEYLRFVTQVDKTKSAVQQSIDKLQMLYDSLAQEYFGGGRQ